jgi:uncharacterized sulfatase
MIVNRRDFLRLIGTGVAALALPGCMGAPRLSGKSYSGDKPNIILILADDQGVHQLSCYGSDFYETPSIDRLAAEGMKFTNAYAAAPVCSPTRASIMTGKYPARLHLTDYIKGSSPKDKKLLVPQWSPFLPLEEVTIAEALKSAGYLCGHFGKWHLNKDKNYKPGRPGDPGSQGFDKVLTTHKPKKGPESPYEEDWHHVRQISEETLAFIEENKDRPFFCYVSHNTIHRPEIERSELIAKYQAKPGADDDRNRPVLGAMVETLDKSTGRILDKLDELKLADKTIVVYFADNGGLGSHDTLKPLRGAKGSLLEGGIREPLLVRWPGVVKAKSRCDEPVTSVDFFPTFLEAAGLKVTDPEVDGESLMGLLTQRADLKRDAIYWHYPHYSPQGHVPAGAIRQGRYKLVEWYEESVDGIHAGGAIELFDLERDVGEQNDLAERMPELAAKLHNKLEAWCQRVGAQEMLKNPGYNEQTV